MASSSPRYAARTERATCDSCGCAFEDQSAEVEHIDVVADVHHECHVVLDKQDPEAALRYDARQYVAEVLRLAMVEAGGRFVEKKQVEVPGKAARELDQASLTCRQVAGLHVRKVLDAADGECRVGCMRHLVGVGPGREDLAEDPGTCHPVPAPWSRSHVRSRVEQLDPLKCSPQASAHAAGAPARDVLAVKHHQTRSWSGQATTRIERCCLARAVRADQGGDAAGRSLEVESIDGNHAAEADRDAGDLESRTPIFADCSRNWTGNHVATSRHYCGRHDLFGTRPPALESFLRGCDASLGER